MNVSTPQLVFTHPKNTQRRTTWCRSSNEAPSEDSERKHRHQIIRFYQIKRGLHGRSEWESQISNLKSLISPITNLARLSSKFQNIFCVFLHPSSPPHLNIALNDREKERVWVSEFNIEKTMRHLGLLFSIEEYCFSHFSTLNGNSILDTCVRVG